MRLVSQRCYRRQLTHLRYLSQKYSSVLWRMKTGVCWLFLFLFYAMALSLNVQACAHTNMPVSSAAFTTIPSQRLNITPLSILPCEHAVQQACCLYRDDHPQQNHNVEFLKLPQRVLVHFFTFLSTESPPFKGHFQTGIAPSVVSPPLEVQLCRFRE